MPQQPTDAARGTNDTNQSRPFAANLRFSSSGRWFIFQLSYGLPAYRSAARSLDDLVLEVLRRQRAGETIGLVQWRALVVAELGAAAGTAFDAMQAGALIVPPANAFGPCLAVVKTSSRPFELGYDEMRLGVVKDLRADSAAARAGLKENDAIVSSTPMAALQSDPSREMSLTVRRAGQPLQLQYLPRGKPVESWQWRNVATAASGSCRL